MYEVHTSKLIQQNENQFSRCTKLQLDVWNQIWLQLNQLQPTKTKMKDGNLIGEKGHHHDLDLGVKMANDLTFHLHVENVVAGA